MSARVLLALPPLPKTWQNDVADTLHLPLQGVWIPHPHHEAALHYLQITVPSVIEPLQAPWSACHARAAIQGLVAHLELSAMVPQTMKYLEHHMHTHIQVFLAHLETFAGAHMSWQLFDERLSNDSSN